ncbi:zinc metalloprotease, partial [Streptomyces spongiae]|uniref:hypothetical protein n=1 Tax=Streptomyces spongiae TaxID=565072 RepID=UPI0018841D58
RPGLPPHIRQARLAPTSEPFLVKLFESDEGSGPGERSRNPVRPVGQYRELLSRVSTLPTARRRTAERVMLWPRAVVGAREHAVGVAYPPLGRPFLLTDGNAQTGDFLLAQEPDFQGCEVPSARQRAELLLDVVVAHELLHTIGLAHGDTNWKNFVYGLESGRGRGRLIDIDSVTALDDPRPPLMHQPGWGDDPTMSPHTRDTLRVALLVARLAAPEPDWDRWAPPELGAPWFTPWLRDLTRRTLDDPREGSVSEFTAALTEALRN